MSIATSQPLMHHGWQIQIVSIEEAFHFQCYAPDFPDFMNDAATYADWELAYAAACEFVDREIAIKALIDLMNDWLITGFISEDEYWQLTNFD